MLLTNDIKGPLKKNKDENVRRFALCAMKENFWREKKEIVLGYYTRERERKKQAN